MARILAISSQVAFGHVGLSAAVPVLQRLGHDVIALPSIVLSSHLGYRNTAGVTVASSTLEHMLEAIAANGWLDAVDAVLTGYLPTAAHVRVAAASIAHLKTKRHGILIVTDPILGDEPGGLYLDASAAAALRDNLIPLATLVTPNAFELSWLTGTPIRSIDDAVAAAPAVAVERVLVTSVPGSGNQLANVLVNRGTGASYCPVSYRERVPHGTGDLLAALFAGHVLCGYSEPDALGKAAAGVEKAIIASHGSGELKLINALHSVIGAQPLPVVPY